MQHLAIRSRQPVMLLICLALSGVVALTIHVAMLAAGVPFPIANPPLWARWMNLSVTMGGAILLVKWSAPRLAGFGTAGRIAVIWLILMAVRETARSAIMQGVVTTAWWFAAASLIDPVGRSLILALLAIFASRHVSGTASLIPAASLTGLIALGAQMLLTSSVAPLLEHLSYLSRQEIYSFPYPIKVLIPAYLTFVEPVAGATFALILAWDRLPRSRVARLVTCALLVAALKGVLGATIFFGPYTGRNAVPGLLSWSQFLLEFLALGLLVGWSLAVFGGSQSNPGSPVHETPEPARRP